VARGNLPGIRAFSNRDLTDFDDLEKTDIIASVEPGLSKSSVPEMP
jgi:hypothetical protein